MPKFHNHIYLIAMIRWYNASYIFMLEETMIKRNIAFIGIITVIFVAFLDFMIVNNALPSIQDYFKISILDLQWVANIYSIMLASTLILFGRLADMLGQRKVFYSGIIFMFVGSLAAAYSQNFALLIFFRAVQTIGISMLLVTGPGIVQAIYQDKSQVPMSIYSAIGGVGLMMGPFLGGEIISFWGWKWVFLINAPILIVGMIVSASCLPKAQRTRLNNSLNADWLGNILLFLSLGSLIYALMSFEDNGFDFVAGVTFAICVLSLMLLIVVERKQQSPSLNFGFLKQTDFKLAMLCNTLAGTMVSCGMFFSPIFLQQNMKLSPSIAGLYLLSFAAVIILFSPLLGQITKKIKERNTIVIGICACFIATIFYILFFTYSSVILAVCAFALTGFALAVNNTVSPISAIKGAGEENAGIAVGGIFAVFNITGAIMLGLCTVILHFINRSSGMSNAYAGTFGFIMVYALIINIISIRSLSVKHNISEAVLN
jgi:MFS family permease